MNRTDKSVKYSAWGVLPNQWKAIRLRDAGKIGSGTTPSTLVLEYWQNGTIPWLPTTKVNDKIIKESDIFITEKAVTDKRIQILPKGSILVAMIGQGKTRGKTALLEIEAWVNQNFAFIVPHPSVESKYLYSILDYNYERIRYEGNRGGNQGSLNTEMIKGFKIPLPPLPEQKAIAQVLSMADAAIQSTEKLIDQKELRKKWLMQQLLTGKKRLKGFGGEWKEEKLGKLFKQIRNVNDGGDGHSVMTISSKLGLISQEDKFDRVIAGDSLKKYTQLIKGDFAYNKGNSKTYPMGCVYRLEEKESALVPFVYICFSTTGLVDGLFYKHWFLAHGLDRQLNKIITSGARGDGLLNVNTEDFFGLKIVFPPKEEQTAIAQVLQAADKEISLLKAKTEKLREQKKGLMQVLLTGKKRLFLHGT